MQTVNFTDALAVVKVAMPRTNEHRQRFVAGMAVTDAPSDLAAWVADHKAAMAKHRATERELRAALQERFGKNCYRIACDGMVHAYGQMPNSTETGWYLVCEADRALQYLETGYR